MADKEKREFPKSEAGSLSKEKHGPKAPMWVIDARVEYVAEVIARGFSYAEIAQHLSEEWGITTRMIDEYCRRARAKLEEAADKARPDHLARHLKLREELLALALDGDDPDIRAALAVADSEAKLLGLVQEKHKHEGTVNHDHAHQLLSTPPEQIEAARRRLEAARASQGGAEAPQSLPPGKPNKANEANSGIPASPASPEIVEPETIDAEPDSPEGS